MEGGGGQAERSSQGIYSVCYCVSFCCFYGFPCQLVSLILRGWWLSWSRVSLWKLETAGFPAAEQKTVKCKV